MEHGPCIIVPDEYCASASLLNFNDYPGFPGREVVYVGLPLPAGVPIRAPAAGMVEVVHGDASTAFPRGNVVQVSVEEVDDAAKCVATVAFYAFTGDLAPISTLQHPVTAGEVIATTTSTGIVNWGNTVLFQTLSPEELQRLFPVTSRTAGVRVPYDGPATPTPRVAIRYGAYPPCSGRIN